MNVRQMVTRYTVSAVPEDHPTWYHWEINVQRIRRRDGAVRWAVLWGPDCLGADGEWDYNSVPSEHSDEWLAEHRFDLETAMRLAIAAAPEIVLNGVKAKDVRTRERTP